MAPDFRCRMNETLGFALGAGMLAALNPCGFAMLPAYLSLFVVGSSAEGASHSRFAAVIRALTATAAMTGGFVAVFAAYALVLAPVASTVQRWLPVATVVIGCVLAMLGALLLAGHPLVVRGPHLRARFDPAANLRSMALYGVSYAIASVSCTIGPFLAVTSTTFRDGDIAAGLAAFVAYAAGMGLVVGVLAVGIALSRDAGARLLRLAMPYLGRAGGVLLIVVGCYVAWYGVYEFRLRAGGGIDDPVVTAASRLQTSASRTVEVLGPAVLALALLALSGGAALISLLRRHRSKASRS